MEPDPLTVRFSLVLLRLARFLLVTKGLAAPLADQLTEAQSRAVGDGSARLAASARVSPVRSCGVQRLSRTAARGSAAAPLGAGGQFQDPGPRGAP